MCQEFKPGVKVQEIETGDQGFIIEKTEYEVDRWRIKWISGSSKGLSLTLTEDKMFVEETTNIVSNETIIENLRVLANSLGYDIIKL